MKSTRLSYLFFLLTSTAALHAQSLIEQDCTIQIQSTGVKLLNWTGHVGRTYFIQSSPDLANWSWAPNIEAGENRPMSYEVDGPAKAGFFRLQYTDLTAPNLDSADFDSDGLTNLEEITQRPRPTGASLNQSLQTSSAMPVPMSTRQISSISTRATLSEYIQTNPLKADTDDDGLTDKWEEDHQLDPTDNGSNNINNGPNGDPDQDGVDNAQEQSLGTDPFGNANTSDSDGDGILDIEDAMPGYGLVSWKRAAECNYVLIEVDSFSTYGYAEDLNDNGEVLFPDGIWSGGNWIAQSPVPVIEVTDNGDPYEIRFGNWTNFNSSQQIMGTASFLVTDGQGAGFGSHIPAIWPSTLSSPIPLPDCMAIFWAIRHWPIGVTESGQMVSRIGKSYPQFSMETINRYSPSGTLISELGGSNGFHPTGGDGHGSVSSSGWIASNLKRDSSSSQPAAYKVGLWDPSDHQVTLPTEANGWGYPISAKDLPDGKFVLTAGAYNGTDTAGRVFLKNPAGQFEYATQLADKKIELFAGDGTALTSDNKLWRNGELTPLADLCPRYKELLVDHHIFPIRSNKNGTYLVQIESTNEGEGTWKNALLLPVGVAVDADRDGVITFDGKDKTTAEKPYRFWVNDDRDIENDVDDGDSEEDDVDSFANDCDQLGLEYSRDLEDLTRLWIDFSGISQVFPASDPTVALKVRIQSESGDPRITFFQPVESDGGRQYLKDETTGSSQLQGSYGQELCRVAGTSSDEIPRRAWETLPSDKVVHLLFEGAKAGDAELIFEIWKDGEKVCDLPTVHIVLKKADDMYETWTIGDVVNEGVDYTKWPAATFSQTTGQDLPAPEKPEEKDYIMLVHGWNMPPWEKETYGSTMFKRMWHQGYKGRFGMFRWPTFHGFEGDFEDVTQDPDHFNASELRAWNSASRLKALIENRAAVFGSDKIRLYAHSMGNIVCGEALRQFGPSGASVHSYIAAQAAISSHAYDKTTTARKPAYQLEMPNVYGYYWQQGASDWPPQWEIDGHPSYMNPQYLPGNVAYINHYNFDDYALNGTRWPLNQDLKPGFNYHYTFQGLVGGYSDYRFIRGPRYEQTILNVPADRYEIFSNAADSVANSLGKVGSTGGKFSESVNVAPLLVYDGNAKAHKYHSGQFRSTIQKRWEYWRIALDNMDIRTPAQ